MTEKEIVRVERGPEKQEEREMVTVGIGLEREMGGEINNFSENWIRERTGMREK